MKKDILINSTSNEVRIAITEDGKLTEFFVESPENERNVGDIYLGKVAKVMRGIRAAFINIGFEQDAFLHFSDVNTSEEYSNILGDDIDETDDDDDDNGNGNVKSKDTPNRKNSPKKEQPKQQQKGQRKGRFQKSGSRGGSRSNKDSSRDSEITLERGQDIIVQITKEPVSNKGMRVTSKVSLPGRYLVLMPFHKKIGISRQINNPREKGRLRKIVRSALPKGYGLIIRTVASGKDENLILDDLNTLLTTWNKIEEGIKSGKAPALLYKDVSTTSSVVRDIFKDDIGHVRVDDKKLFKEIKNYLDLTTPEFSDKLEHYSGNQPLFDAYSIEKQLDNSLNKKVWVKGAGYLVIEITEAMTVIDVNSGKYAKSSNQEVNSLNTNIEAAKEIVRQIRLRDLGGIIVVDFIDLYDDKNRRKLYDEIRKEFRKDRAKATILPMSEFGLVQITRQRIRQSIIHRVYDSCPMCHGTGKVQSRTSFLTSLERWLQRYKGSSSAHSLTLKVNPIVEAYLKYGILSISRKLAFKYKTRIKVVQDTNISLDEFRFFSRKTGEDVTDEFLN